MLDIGRLVDAAEEAGVDLHRTTDGQLSQVWLRSGAVQQDFMCCIDCSIASSPCISSGLRFLRDIIHTQPALGTAHGHQDSMKAHVLACQVALGSKATHPGKEDWSPLSNQQEMGKYSICCLKVVP